MTALTDKLALLQDQTDLARLVIAGKANEPVVELLPQLQATLDQARAATRSEFAASDGADKVGYGSGRTVADKLGEVVSLADCGLAGDGSDETDKMEAALIRAAGKTLIGEKGKTYRFTRELFVQDYTFLDFRGAMVIDDVRQYWGATYGGRAAPLFNTYGTKGVQIKNLGYSAAASRATLGNVTIPTCPFWNGDNRFAPLTPTQDLTIENVIAYNCAPGTMFISIAGETLNWVARNIAITGNCAYGINAEYGNPATEADREGNHPYNGLIENFCGYDNTESEGFIRVASCYNVLVRNCYGKNVRKFIWCWVGDRSISRVSQNVRYENCTHHATTDFMPGAANYCMTILCADKDGSTGDPLPAWTNYDHLIEIDNCQFQNTTTAGSACVRFIGMQGKVRIKGGLMQGSYYGIWCEPSTNPSYASKHSLTIDETVFKGCVQDIYLNSIHGTLVNRTRHKNGTGALAAIKVTNGSDHTRIEGARFEPMSAARAYVEVDAGCVNTTIIKNVFENDPSVPPLELRAPVEGSGNVYAGEYLAKQGWIYYAVAQQIETQTISLLDVPVDAGLTTLDAGKRKHYEVQSGAVDRHIHRILGGKLGDEIVISSYSVAAAVVFRNLYAGVGTTERILAPTNADQSKSGSFWTARLRKTTGGWVLSE